MAVKIAPGGCDFDLIAGFAGFSEAVAAEKEAGGGAGEGDGQDPARGGIIQHGPDEQAHAGKAQDGTDNC